MIQGGRLVATQVVLGDYLWQHNIIMWSGGTARGGGGH